MEIRLTDALLLSFTKCLRAAEEGAWSRWYDEEQLPALLSARDRPSVATRWELAQRGQPGMPGLGFTHMTLFEFEGEDALGAAEALITRGGELRRRGQVHPAHAVTDVQVFRAHGLHRAKTPPSASLHGHILAWVLCTDPAREAEWDAWYDREHVPDMRESGAFSALSRWIRAPRGRFGPQYLTLYDIAVPSIEEAVTRSAESLRKLTAAGRKHPCHTGGLAITLIPSGRHGGCGLRGADIREEGRS